MEEFKELRSDGNDPLFDKTNMLYKAFPSNFRQIRYFTLLIVQSAPLEIKEINLLEQQISEVIKNAVSVVNGDDDNARLVLGRAVVTSITPGAELPNLYRKTTFADRIRAISTLPGDRD